MRAGSKGSVHVKLTTSCKPKETSRSLVRGYKIASYMMGKPKDFDSCTCMYCRSECVHKRWGGGGGVGLEGL